MKKILVIGDIVVDILPSPFPFSKDVILNDGETFIDGIVFQRGGCAGNFVSVLKTIAPDFDVRFISRIGNDEYGKFLISEMEKYGVTPLFKVVDNVRTQATIAISYKDGERHFLTYLGGLEEFSLSDIDFSLFEGIDHLAYRGPWFSEMLLLECSLFLKKAHSMGIPTSVDLGFDPLWTYESSLKSSSQSSSSSSIKTRISLRKKAILDALPYIHYLFGNTDEIIHLTGEEDIISAVSLLFSKGLSNLVLHRGSKGARLYFSQKPPYSPSLLKEIDSCCYYLDIPAASVDVLNPVGSGDTFDSIFVALISSGKDPVYASIYASAGAAYSLMSPPGTRIQLSSLDDILENNPNFLSLKQLLSQIQ